MKNSNTLFYSFSLLCTSMTLFANSEWGISEIQGKRPRMEDRFVAKTNLVPGFDFFAIYDGHGGPAVAQELSNEKTGLHTWFKKELIKEKENSTISDDSMTQLISRLCIAYDKHLLKKQTPDENFDTEISSGTGSTAIVALTTPKKVYFAWVGDARGLLFDHLGRLIFTTEDHSVTNKKEIERIEENNGFLEDKLNYGLRISSQDYSGSLNMTRAFGDREDKINLPPNTLIAQPQVVVHDLQPNDLIFLACDGVFESKYIGPQYKKTYSQFDIGPKIKVSSENIDKYIKKYGPEALSNKQVIEIIRDNFTQSSQNLAKRIPKVQNVFDQNVLNKWQNHSENGENLALIAEIIHNTAINNGSGDNISAMIVKPEVTTTVKSIDIKSIQHKTMTLNNKIEKQFPTLFGTQLEEIALLLGTISQKNFRNTFGEVVEELNKIKNDLKDKPNSEEIVQDIKNLFDDIKNQFAR